MEKIVVDGAVLEKLEGLEEYAVVCDTHGRALGLYSPLPRPLEEYELDPPLSIAELEELRKVRTGKPLEEILGRLGLT